MRAVGGAALERVKAFNPRAIQARRLSYVGMRYPPNQPPIDLDDLTETETTQPVVFRCIQCVAEDFAGIPVRMYQGTPEDRGDELTGDAHSLLNLLRNPSPDVSAYVWRQNIAADIYAAGDWFAYKYRGANRRIHSFGRFMPSEITPQPDKTGRRLLSHYEWRTDDARGFLGMNGSGVFPIAVDDMAHIKTRNPEWEGRGLGRLQRLRYQLHIDRVMQEWQFSRYANGIPTQYAIFFNGRFSEGQRDAVEADLRRKHAGPDGDQFMLIESNDAGQREFTIEQFPRPTEEELAFLNSEQRIMYRVIMAMGVPPIKVMDLSQSSVISNADGQLRMYWNDTIPSVMNLYVAWLNDLVRTEYAGEGAVFFEADYSGVAELQENKLEQSQILGNGVDRGALTRNEYRESMGWPPITPDDPRYVEELDQFLQNGRKLGGTGLEGLFPMLGGAQDNGTEQDQVDDEEDDLTEDDPMDEFPEDEDGEKVVKLATRKGFEHLMGMIDLHEEKKKFDRTVRRKILAMIRASGKQTLDSSGIVGSFDITDPRVFEYLETQTVELVEQVITNTNSMVRSAVADGIAAGDPIAGMRRRVQDAFEVRREPYQLDRISRTEVHTAQEGGGQLAAEQNGVEMKRWITARDSRVRGLEANDKADHDGIEQAGPIPLKVAFVDPRSGAQLMFPGDRSGALSGADTINCRCASIPDFSHLELAARPTRRKGIDEIWFEKADQAEVWERDFARTIKSYLIGMQRRALHRFDELAQQGGTGVSATGS